jgi:hypothetical protein
MYDLLFNLAGFAVAGWALIFSQRMPLQSVIVFLILMFGSGRLLINQSTRVARKREPAIG